MTLINIVLCLFNFNSLHGYKIQNTFQEWIILKMFNKHNTITTILFYLNYLATI